MREHFLLLLLSFCISYLSAQSDSVLAVQYYKNGDSLIYEGLYYDAISQLEEAVELGKRAFGEQSSFNAKTLRALGTAQGYVYQLKKSQQSLQQSIKIYEALNDVKSRDYANSIGELASTLSSLGNYEKSIIYWLKVQDLYYDLFEEGDGVFAPLYYNIGNTYLGKEDANLALEYFERALALDRKRGDDLAIADDYDNIGVAYDLLGKYDKALQYFNDAIAIYGTEVGVMSDYYAHVLLQKASSLKKMGQPQEAIGPLMNALKISYQIFGPINSESAAILDLMGECYTALGEYELAEDKFNSALAALNYDETQNVLTEVDHLDQLVQVLGHKAGLLFTLAKRDESNLEIAAKQYGLAFNVIDSLRATYSERSSKLDKADEYADLFEGAIECYFQLGKAEGRNYQSNLFELFEKDKSLLLLEALNETFAQQFAGIPEEVLAKEQYLKAELAVLDEEKFYENQMGPDKDEAIINDLNGQIFDLKKQLNSFSNQLEQDYPEYYKLKYSWNINSLSEVQESLSADEIMLTFYVGNENSYVLFISNDDSWVHKYESIQTEELGQQIVALREGIYSYFLLSSSEQDQETYQSYLTVYQQAAFELYETLFVPIEKELTGKRLILIPDGVLGYVPFDALLSSKPNSDAALKDYDYLIKQFNLAYSYSASSLLRFKELKTSNNLKSLLAFAPSFEEQGEALASRRIRGVLTPLKYNVSEVEAIKALVRGDIVTGQEATKDAFLEKAPDYSILHLSTHGKANDKVGDFSYLAFAKGAGTVDESLLYVRDLYTLNLNADMVVLSACETGIGELQNGEGIASLSSGFSYAGAKNIITTLWSVNDAQTKDLINRFYSLLTEGIDKATALQKAKLNYINEVPKAKSHPFYWSGFISIGDQEKINFSTSPSLINLLLYFAPFLIIIFIAIGGVSIIRKNTTNFF